VPNGVGVSLARNRRSPKRPSEPRPSGVHPEEVEVAQNREPDLATRSGGEKVGGDVHNLVGRSQERER
jgi:hypothetical protein